MYIQLMFKLIVIRAEVSLKMPVSEQEAFTFEAGVTGSCTEPKKWPQILMNGGVGGVPVTWGPLPPPAMLSLPIAVRAAVISHTFRRFVIGSLEFDIPQSASIGAVRWTLPEEDTQAHSSVPTAFKNNPASRANVC